MVAGIGIDHLVLDERDAATFSRCMDVGGVAVFPSDTVYGLACDPARKEAVDRLYALKRRRTDKPSSIMFFSLELALAALPELGPRTRAALAGLLPGPVGLILANPRRRFGLATGGDPQALGLRVPALAAASAALHAVSWPVLQSSANLSGGPDPLRVDDVPAPLREAADLVLDGGRLPGTPSSVVDLRGFERHGTWRLTRPGAVARPALQEVLGPEG